MALSVADLAALGAAPADTDRVTLIDVSDTTDSADGTYKTVTVDNLRDAVIQIQTFIADPSGGATVDAEARTAINAILDLLIAVGAMEAS